MPKVNPKPNAIFCVNKFGSVLNLCCATDASEKERNINVPKVSAMNSRSQSFLTRKTLFTLYLNELHNKV